MDKHVSMIQDHIDNEEVKDLTKLGTSCKG